MGLRGATRRISAPSAGVRSRVVRSTELRSRVVAEPFIVFLPVGELLLIKATIRPKAYTQIITAQILYPSLRARSFLTKNIKKGIVHEVRSFAAPLRDNRVLRRHSRLGARQRRV